MHTGKIVDALLEKCLSGLHAKLAESVKSAVDGALSGEHLSLSKLARSVASPTAMRHRVKRMDRLLGNVSLHGARTDIYKEVAVQWSKGGDDVQVLIDWSDATTDQRWHLLRASVAVDGRSVTLYEEIHPQRKLGNQKVHRLFLERVAEILPNGCRPTVITDAGFHSTWFDLVTERQWQWIGRIRGHDMVSIADGPWRKCSEVFQDATPQVQTFAEAQYVRSHPTACRLMLVKRVARGRSRLTRMGKHAKSRVSLKAARSASEPWLLACSPRHTQTDSEKLVTAYAKRMRIEQSFRDLKNERLGLGFSAARTSSRHRLEILLLIAYLTSWLMRLIGEAAQQAKMHPYFQSVPGLKHKEISVLTLARRVIDAGLKWLAQLRPDEAVTLLRGQAQGAYDGG